MIWNILFLVHMLFLLLLAGDNPGTIGCTDKLKNNVENLYSVILILLGKTVA